MPNRVIKESIKTSEQIDSLTWFEEALYYRLLVTADDYGCADGRTTLLKSELFPLKENVTKKSVEDAISKLVKVGLLYKYTANGKPYLFFPTWEKHQRIRNKHRKYPNPFDNGVSDDCTANGWQMPADCMSESESESNTNTNPNPNPKAARVREAFSVFWSVYPKKVGKAAAEKAFAKVPEEAYPLILPAIEQQAQSRQWQKDNGQFIPNPATWLNQQRWNDELPKASVDFLDLV